MTKTKHSSFKKIFSQQFLIVLLVQLENIIITNDCFIVLTCSDLVFGSRIIICFVKLVVESRLLSLSFVAVVIRRLEICSLFFFVGSFEIYGQFVVVVIEVLLFVVTSNHGVIFFGLFLFLKEKIEKQNDIK